MSGSAAFITGQAAYGNQCSRCQQDSQRSFAGVPGQGDAREGSAGAFTASR
jgi:hypothetical protein